MTFCYSVKNVGEIGYEKGVQMNELQIVSLEKTEISSWDFESIKAELAQALSVYKNMVYTDESIKSAKDDKAVLAKVKKLVEDQRKAYKAKCLAPYDAIEPQVKEIVSMIEEQRVLIDDVVKDYTERKKQEKEEEVKKYYDKKAFILGELAQPLFGKLLDPKWLNASTPKSKYEEGIQEAISRAKSDIDTIKAINSPFVDTLIEKYTETLSVDEAKAKHEELVLAASKAGLNQQSVATNAEVKPSTPIAENIENGVSVRIFASQGQLNQIFDFMKAIGATYEIQ